MGNTVNKDVEKTAVVPVQFRNPAGDYDPGQVIEHVLPRLASGETLRAMRRDNPNLPAPSTIRLWAILDQPPGFAEQYARAREMHADELIEEAFEIADDGSQDTITKTRQDGSEYETEDKEWVSRSRLRVDTRKWAAARLAPKKYGDKLQMSGDPENPQVLKVILQRE